MDFAGYEELLEKAEALEEAFSEGGKDDPRLPKLKADLRTAIQATDPGKLIDYFTQAGVSIRSRFDKYNWLYAMIVIELQKQGMPVISIDPKVERECSDDENHNIQ